MPELKNTPAVDTSKTNMDTHSDTMQDVTSKVDFIALEHEILDFWKNHDTFNKLRKQNAGNERWSFLDGPITANNPMGVHHAWGRSYKDLYQRFHAMLGQDQRYQNGFDCQGLWVEVEVEKELKFKSKTDIETYGIEKFVEACKARVLKYSAIQTEQSKRLGYWMDWDDSYFTMSEENNYSIWKFLKKVHERGLIFKGYDVMPWCTRCGAALSEHEIATEGYKELTHTSIYLKFPLKDHPGENLLVWTTTPWTLSSNVMAAVNPTLDYVKVSQGKEIYYLVKSRLSILQGEYEILAEMKGQALLGWQYYGPFDELPIQQGIEHAVIAWDDVSETDGTGIVHIAPGCGREDHQLSKRDGFPVLRPIDEFGNYLDGYGEWVGKNVAEINSLVIDNLSGKGLRYKKEPITHRYPTCWRHGTELVFRLVDEWFISMDALREEIMAVVRQIKWYPEYGLDRELDWLRNMGDWMISKKRYWGLALPIFECKSCGHVHVIGSREELRENAVEGWDAFDGHTPHRPWIDQVKIKCEKCGEIVSRIPDVGNPWLDAGIVPYSTIHYLTDHEYWEKWFPADFIVESLPGQFRNWFYAILAMSTVMENRPPVRTIMGHALVKDEHGDDMHKSSGNAIWFEDAAEKMGVDVMRWMYASQVPYNNLNFGYHAADDVRRKLLTLWNTYSFFVTYAKLDHFDPKLPLDETKLTQLDRWLLARLNQLIQQSRSDYENFQVDKLIHKVNRFIDDLSNWYVRRSRRRFWKSENDQDKWAAYHTLYQALTTTIRILAPVIPFVTESIYQNLVVALNPDAPESVHLSGFPVADERWIDDALMDQINTIIKTVELGRAARNKANLKVRQPLAGIQVFWPEVTRRKFVAELQQQVLDELNIKTLTVLEEAGESVSYDVKPNLAILGPKYGKDLGRIRKLLLDADVKFVATQVQNGSTVTLTDNVFTVTLEPGDLLVSVLEPAGRAIVEDGGAIVILDTVLTDELLEEGMIRDLVRHVQNLRKEADFDVSDRIKLTLETEAALTTIILKNADYLKSETLAESLDFIQVTAEPKATFSVGEFKVTAGAIKL